MSTKAGMARIVRIWKKQFLTSLSAQWLTPLRKGHTCALGLPGAATVEQAAICSATGKSETGLEDITPKLSGATGYAHKAAQGSAQWLAPRLW